MSDKKPMTNGEKLLSVFPKADLENISPCKLGLIGFLGKKCLKTSCVTCIEKYMTKPYEKPHRLYSTAENNTEDFKEE